MLPDVIIDELAKKWHERRSRLLDAMYQDRYKADRNGYSRKACWLASIIYCMFSIVDYFVFPDIVYILTISRFVLVAVFSVLIETQFRRNAAARHIDYVFAFGLVLANMSICILLTQTIHNQVFSIISSWVLFSLWRPTPYVFSKAGSRRPLRCLLRYLSAMP